MGQNELFIYMDVKCSEHSLKALGKHVIVYVYCFT
jgi:hypothetical protein